MDFTFENNSIKLNNDLFKPIVFKQYNVRKSVNPLYLSSLLKNSHTFNLDNNLNRLNKSLFVQDYNRNEEISNKLSSIIKHKVVELNFDRTKNLMLSGKINIGDNRYIDFGREFKNQQELNQYCTFIDDLYFIKESVGHSLKCKLSKSGNLKFFTDTKNQLTKDNISNYFNSVVKEYNNKLNALRRENFNVEKSINKLEFELSSKQLSNDNLISKIEKFSLCKNNLKNALKYYFIDKDNSVYRSVKNLFNRINSSDDDIYFNNISSANDLDILSPRSSTNKLNDNLKYMHANSSEKLKENIHHLMQQVSDEKTIKSKLTKKYDIVKKAYKNAINNEQTIKYIMQKISQNSDGILKIMNYRKHIIKELKIYGFKVASIQS